jgi:hypothetical protein
MIKDVQAYEKPAEYADYCDDQNDHHGMLRSRRRVVIIVIAAQGYLLSMDSTKTQR